MHPVRLKKGPFPIARSFSLITLLLLGFFHITPTAIAQDVCERKPQVSKTIVASLAQVDNCEDVTDEHLRTILYLNLSHKELDRLEPHDFRGLSRLIDINLEYNALETLPIGLFANLRDIEIIRLGNNRLSELPDNAFSKLPNLRILKLNNNLMHTLSANTFADLPSLYEIDIQDNLIMDSSDAILISDAILQGMPSLNSLILSKDSIKHISPYIFGHVSFLRLETPPPNLYVGDYKETLTFLG